MKSLINLLCILTILISAGVQVNGQIWLSNGAIFEEAEDYLNAEEYVEALPLYLLLEKKGIINPHIAYKIGTCYLNIRGKKHLSVAYLENAVKSVSDSFKNTFSETNAPVKALLLLGVAYRVNNQLDKAVETFKTLRQRIQDTDPDYVVLVDLHIQRCENARLLNAFPNEPRTERLPDNINTVFSNYNPVLVGQDSLLYYMEELKFYDAVMRSRNIKGEWSDPENITPAIGSDGDHILVGASPDGETLLLYYYEPLRAGEICFTTYNNGKWSKLEPLNDNVNSVYHETHASISADGRTLYFTSNRDGGYGGLDIYKSVLDENNEWGPALNLGPVINTPFNEETPIINVDDEILYFSSQGHLSMGGYDIFYALRKGENDWRQPINMGAPVSTTDDDLFYYPLEEHVSGLMSRIDQVATSYDIYRYNSMVFANSPRFNVKGKAQGIDSTNYEDYNLEVVNKADGTTLQNIPLSSGGDYEATLPAGDFDLVVKDKNETVSISTVSMSNDSPESTLLIAESTSDKVTDQSGSSEELLPEKTGTENIPVIYEQPGKLATEKSDTLWLRNILYAFDDYQLADEYQHYLSEVQKIMISNPSVTLTIEGHTDDIGPATYNLALSKKRAESVKSYILTKEIDNSRIRVVEKGEDFPIALNRNPDGSDCPQGRKYNRRVVLLPGSEVKAIVLMHADPVPENLRK
jgi:outer membrane protein OmpA-like peptidoglycan-associated protein